MMRTWRTEVTADRASVRSDAARNPRFTWDSLSRLCRWPVVFAAAVVLASSACERAELPTESSAASDSAPEVQAAAAAAGAGTTALEPPGTYTVQLPIPSGEAGQLAGRYSYSFVDLGVHLPENVMYRIRVEGALTASMRRAYAWYCEKSNISGCGEEQGTYGPTGRPETGELEVKVRVGSSQLDWTRAGQYAVEATTTRGGIVKANRRGIGDSYGCYYNRPPGYEGPGPCYKELDNHHTQEYDVTGEQILIATPIADQLEVEADTNNVSPGTEVTFTASTTDDTPFDVREWIWVPDSVSTDSVPADSADGSTEPADSTPSGPRTVCGTERTCHFPVPVSGRMYARAVVNGVVQQAGEPIEVDASACTEADIEIVRAGGPNPGGSFTTATEEKTITMEASLTGDCEDVDVEWEVTGDTDNELEEEGPGSLPGKLRVQWLMPHQDEGRWTDYEHPGTLFDKYIGFEAVAVAVDGEEEIRSEPEAFRQDEIDTARQEYMDYEREWVPPRLFWGRPSSANFSPGDLNRVGDYGVYIASPVLLGGLEALRAAMSEARETDTPLFVTNAYRNPVHHTEHIGSDDSESWHQYGFAADIRIWDHAETREEFWDLLWLYTKELSDPGCVEPKRLLWIELEDGREVLSHFHVDWRAESCKPGW